MNYSEQTALRKSRRRAFLLGVSPGRRPPTERNVAVAQARRALSFIELQDRHALLVESALSDVDQMLRVVSMSLATITVIARRLPPLERARMIDQVFTEARLLLEEQEDDARATRH
jgi:hypothetical protein